MQSRKTVTGLNPPRIYCISPASVGSAAEREQVLSRLLAHVNAMQFDSVLLTDAVNFSAAVPDAIVSDDSSESTDDNTNDQALAALAAECARHGLRLFIDVEIDRFARSHPLVAEHGERFFDTDRIGNELPDPRKTRVAQHDHRAQLRLDADGIAIALDYWKSRIAGWLDAGISGFRCLGIARIAPTIWRQLADHGRTLRGDAGFLAWTPGCTPEQLNAIADCGFDAVFSSHAWWDYRSGWLAEEHQRLSQIAPVIATTEDPAGPRLLRALHAEDAVLSQRGYRRALLSALATGDGVMVVQGFECGTDVPLADLDCDPRWHEPPLFNLSVDIAHAIRQAAERRASPQRTLELLSAPHAEIALVLRPSRDATAGQNARAWLTIINADLAQPHVLSECMLRERAAGWVVEAHDGGSLTLQPGDVQTFAAQMPKPVVMPTLGGKPAVVRATRVPRIAIESVTPSVDGGRFAVKKTVGAHVDIEADIFSDGHDHLAAAVLWRAADQKEWQEVRMEMVGNDRWRATLPLQRIGRHYFVVEAWRDTYDTYRDELEKKTKAGLDVTLEVQEGRQLIERTIAGQAEDSLHVDALKRALKQLPARSKKKNGVDNRDAIALLLSAEVAHLMLKADLRDFATRTSCEYKIDVERKRAEFSNWYELFPRSQSGDTKRHGTFDDVIKRLPAVRDMGFDTLYFPPIHPIGSKNKKGKNNTLTPAPDDPGSPYAIGSPAGGHDAIHPELGTLDDFRRLVAAAREHGLEIALDFAIQCSPDHPWLQQHPEWFAYRPDGSIRYAENPPKKYEDIVNVDFYAEAAIPDLWIALRDVVLLWVREGVRTFRVDNPHTKPLPFWEWMIGEVRMRAPDTLFLSEAFTRPKPMYRLAKVGFSQSYTYFTWRHTKQEFVDYLTELTASNPPGGPREFFRPHFFVNTPDINPVFLQKSGRPGHLIRAALAATLSGLWGVYSGFELCEAQPMPGKEEYLDSEKYEIRAWDWNRPGNIVREVTQLNRIRNGNPALHTHLNVRFHPSSSDQILFFSKSTIGEDGDRFGDNTLLIAVNLDPFNAHDATLDLPLWRFELSDQASLEVEELMTESRFTWQGRQQFVRLDPQQMPFAIWRVRPAGR